MAQKMLIDASHAEETRVVVVDGNKVEEFDFESLSRRQITGNIYLAKVTRVEPSLQAAFVDYGGNRHGFLAFSEIHPDYYQIPSADRAALLDEERAYQRRQAEEEDRPHKPARLAEPAAAADGDAQAAEGADLPADDAADAPRPDVETAEDGAEAPAPKKPRARRYRIQEVIKPRQILLVQVIKEERGTKGAALTTYLSLAGRYCVLMPNTARGGGISRKITAAGDRKKLREIADSLSVPEGAGLIIRTAGAQRNKTEIKRDYDFLLRQWEQIRQTTLESIAPKLIHEEGSLIKRAIRDLYSRDIDEVIVEGERGYREAKDYMKMLMPSHARNVKPYADTLPLFARYQVETYLAGMFNPVVQLKSGGYIVIDVTEALVAIDVNSGRSTREGSIEETALKTNLEAAEEAARQMRLRDLAGLIVIDFIDMDDRKNNAAVEKRLKDRLKSDRARIQVGRISSFGLLEMSRQRLRPGMVETMTKPCAHCHGTGRVRSDDSMALAILRELEEEGVRQRSREVVVNAPVEIANYLLNQKRERVMRIEARFDMVVQINGDPSLVSPDFRIEKLKTATRPLPRLDLIADLAQPSGSAVAAEIPEAEASDPANAPTAAAPAEAAGTAEETPKPKRRSRSRGRGRKRGGAQTGTGPDAAQVQGDAAAPGATGDTGQPAPEPAQADAAATGAKRSRPGTDESGADRSAREDGAGAAKNTKAKAASAGARAAEDPDPAGNAPARPERTDEAPNDRHAAPAAPQPASAPATRKPRVTAPAPRPAAAPAETAAPAPTAAQAAESSAAPAPAEPPVETPSAEAPTPDRTPAAPETKAATAAPTGRKERVRLPAAAILQSLTPQAARTDAGDAAGTAPDGADSPVSDALALDGPRSADPVPADPAPPAAPAEAAATGPADPAAEDGPGPSGDQPVAAAAASEPDGAGAEKRGGWWSRALGRS